jgi:hypothetical protein
MADDSDRQDIPQLPPKLDLRRQGILKKEPALKPEQAAKQETSRLVVTPIASPAPTDAPGTAPGGVNAPFKPDAAPAPKPEDKAEAVPDVPRAARLAPAVKASPLMPKPLATRLAPAAQPEPKAPAAAADGAPVDASRADTKRKTSRIPIEKATGAPKDEPEAAAASLKPKTIKIRPTAPIPKIRATQPLSITAPMTEEANATISADAKKRKTSRIPLEDALTADKEGDDAAAETEDPARPKTIKIKRPGSSMDAPTVKLKKTTLAEEEPAPAEMNKTARLDSLPLDDADATPTQKKTIRVKRPSAPVGGKPEIHRTGPGGLSLTPPEALVEEESDEPGAVWAVLGMAATLVLCVVVYMLAAQAIGPNTAGTQISAWKDGPNLSWPGKIIN